MNRHGKDTESEDSSLTKITNIVHYKTWSYCVILTVLGSFSVIGKRERSVGDN